MLEKHLQALADNTAEDIAQAVQDRDWKLVESLTCVEWADALRARDFRAASDAWGDESSTHLAFIVLGVSADTENGVLDAIARGDRKSLEHTGNKQRLQRERVGYDTTSYIG